MIITVDDWRKLESSFREIAVKWARYQAQHFQLVPNYAGYCAQMNLLADSGDSPEKFSSLWKKTFSADTSMDIAEELAHHSKLYRKAHRVIAAATQWTRAELKYGRGFLVKSKDDIEAYEKYMHWNLPYDSGLVIDHAFYAIYVAWQPESKIIVPDNRLQLLKALAIDDSLFRVVSPRQFEELVAFLYECLGCRVELTQATRDFGADILAWHGGPLSSEILIAIQVKRYAAHRKVSLKEIFELHGAVTHYHADTGHIVTSSDFSKPAKEFSKTTRYHLVNLKQFQKEILALFKS